MLLLLFFLPSIVHFFLTHISISPTLLFSLFVLVLLMLTTRKELWRSKWTYMLVSLFDRGRLLLLVSSFGESFIFPNGKKKERKKVAYQEFGLCLYGSCGNVHYLTLTLFYQRFLDVLSTVCLEQSRDFYVYAS
jgi:hypothetical protein